MIRCALKRSARRSLSRVAMQNIRRLKQKPRRRCNLQEIKLAKAWSAGDNVLKESWTKLRTAQPRFKLQSVSNHRNRSFGPEYGLFFCLLEQKADAAKKTGKGWLNWGRSESEASINDLKRRADETQEAWASRFEDAKRRAAEKGEDIKQRAQETEEEFRDRVAKAIQKR